MIDAFDLWNSFQSSVNTFQGGWFRPQTDFIQSCNDLSKEFWVKKTKEAEKSQQAKDDLFPFLKSKNYIVNNKGVYGTFKPDADYGRFAAARVIVNGNNCFPSKDIDDGKCCNGNFKSEVEMTEEFYDTIKQYDIELIDDNKWGAVNKHKTKFPTVSNPKMRQIDAGFQVAPRMVSVVVMDYYREPKEATFVYTNAPGNVQTGAGDQIVYNKKDSIPLEWPFNMRDEFLVGLGRRYSIFTREQFLFATAQAEKK
jgi:hypothetical protein